MVLHEKVCLPIELDDGEIAGKGRAYSDHATRGGREVVDEETRATQCSLEATHEATMRRGVDLKIALHDRHATGLNSNPTSGWNIDFGQCVGG